LSGPSVAGLETRCRLSQVESHWLTLCEGKDVPVMLVADKVFGGTVLMLRSQRLR
jgi:hypothetical protein